MKKMNLNLNKEMKEKGFARIPLKNGEAVVDYDGEITSEDAKGIWVTIKDSYEWGEHLDDIQLFMSLEQLNEEADGVTIEL